MPAGGSATDASPRPEVDAPAQGLGLMGRRWGSGEHTFVLLHGLGVASRMTAPVGRRLGEWGTVLAPDLPGFGASSGLEPVSVPEQGRMLAERLSRLPGPTTLLGCSLGAQIAIHAAAHLGDRLHSLVLVSPTVDGRRRSITEQMLRWPLEMVMQPPGMIRIQLEDHRAAGPGRVLWTLRTALDDRPEDVASEIVAPTLVVRGSRDPLVSTEWTLELASRIPGARHLVLPGRHAMTFTEPEALADAVRVFLTGLDSTVFPRMD